MATLIEVPVPNIGDFADVPIVELLVTIGDMIAVEDPLVVVESDKATIEVPSPVAGTVRELRVAVGDRVSEGAVLVLVEPGADAPAPEPAPSDASAPSSEAASASSIASATVAEAQSTSGGTAAATPGPEPEPEPEPEQGERPAALHASPVARRMAREQGVDLAALTGTGPNGRITKDDVAAAAAPASSIGSGLGGRVALTRIQQLSRDNLTRAWQTIPHVTHHEDADVTELEAFRKQCNADQTDVKVTMVALLLKASAATLGAFPRFAARLDGDELVLAGERHIAFAADTPNGLLAPVLRDVDTKGLLEIAGELSELSAKARAGKLGPSEMSGAVFTISSLGGIGGTGFTPIINPPQVAILGAVRAVTRPVWDPAASEFSPRLILPLSLSYDHRVIDGAAAARFCVHLAQLLGDLRRVLL